MTVSRVHDVGTHILLSVGFAGHALKARLDADAVVNAPGDTVWLQVVSEHSCFYKDEELVP